MDWEIICFWGIAEDYWLEKGLNVGFNSLISNRERNLFYEGNKSAICNVNFFFFFREIKLL